ncbi:MULTISPECIES: molybdenum cofactor guanylyltransferase MobA [Pseudomonas]|jgi:molybdopterin-guanine dinucleotide biosynthesis protein A|uniref:Molybdenum cofactor guanylyltransferase n=1 Tax=Pseudomonas frederiksbergensis TaxID=104087 RepID=A0A0B1Z945_9PSED|nr:MULTISPECIES: molybdenum cofactor guanylyltransferase MobA [Pseudomonas]KHK65917.1 molybdopterin-guanine dinucleotide biosynthesis protein A [Pseudomonas frederiksbergensis]MBI6621705.1 molybdenum cofactor guanylyltransferase MobA [Pseudomonas corrugata]MBI6694021.1 molybdenum cofactor guanylyltransferase MobA [Pseudomonas corrugata]WRV66752.1 molybdenum cofactor guanylyltransferase MobA [Pseudomonas frederiksbergensis]
MIMIDPLPSCSILLLAGGRGQRMGGQDKGLLEWQGRPLIAHLHRKTRALSDDLIISCNRNRERYAMYADQLVHDEESDFPGPLAGIRAGLRAARHPYLLVLPCDVPQIDTSLLQSMRETASRNPDKPLMVRHGEHWEPLLCVIPSALAGAFEQAWSEGERSPGRIMRALHAVALQCPPDDPRLANLNTPELLVQHKGVSD